MIEYYYKSEIIIDLPLKYVLEPNIQKQYNITTINPKLSDNTFHNISLEYSCTLALEKVLKSIDIYSKRF